MDKDLKEMKDRLRQAEQNFNYADDDYIDAAIMEMNTVNEKFRAMLREKKKEGRERKDNAKLLLPSAYRRKSFSV